MKTNKMNFIIMVILMIALTACGSDDGTTQNAENDSGSNGDVYQMEMTLAGTSGTFYLQGSGLSDYLNKQAETFRVTPVASGGGVENTRLIGDGQVELGLAFESDLFQAWEGEGPYEKKYQEYRQLGPAQQLTGWMFIALADSGIDDLSDLEGENFSPGAPGSGAAEGSDTFLKAIDLYDSMNISYNAFSELTDMLKDGDVKSFARTGSVPIPVAQEIDSTNPMKVLDLKPYMDDFDFLEKYPYFEEMEIPAGTYNGQDEDAVTFAQSVQWIVHKDVPDEVVEEFLELSYSDDAIEHLDGIHSDHDHKNDDWLEEQLYVPLHPAAEKFWEDRGSSIPDPMHQ